MKVRTMLRGLLGACFAAVVLAATAGLAQNGQGQNAGDQGQNNNDQGRRTPRSVPEFDPAAIGAIAAVVAGGGVLLARRRKGN